MKNPYHKGFTPVELLVVLSILTTFAAVIVGLGYASIEIANQAFSSH